MNTPNIKNSRYRFHLRPSLSPTYYNLYSNLQAQGWRYTRIKWLAKFSEKNFAFNATAAEHLEFKHLLAKLIANYCPQVMPETYSINDYNWSTVLSQLADTHYFKNNQLFDQVEDLAWILKPALLNNGQHIKVFQQLSQLEAYYIRSNRLGGEHVLQRYISQPHLLHGHKYSIRMFVVVTNYAGAYLYHDGYINLALQPYQAHNFTDLSGHLTNEHLTASAANVTQLPTQQFDFFPDLYPQIKTIITDIMTGLHIMHPDAFLCQRQRTLAIFGFDFMVDADNRVWLLEANHGPCFPTTDDHPLQQNLYRDFWQAFVASFALPIAARLPNERVQYQLFKSVLRGP